MLISVIIPTRERARYLRHSVQTALGIDDADVEIIVSDNASEDETPDVLAAIDDARLRHIRTDRRLSMRQNFQFALDHARGDYVIYFGDDDGILPGQFPILRELLERERPDGLSWSLLTYGWPTREIGKKSGGIRFRPNAVFGETEWIDTAARLAATERADLRNFQYFPRIYHGAASREYLRRAANADGVFFCGSIPDVYFCYRACQTGGRFLFARHPFSINGYSPASTGGSHGAGSKKETRATSAQRFHRENEDDPLRDVIPSSHSIALAFFATLETIAERFPEPPIRPDYPNWYAHVLSEARTKSPDLRDEIIASLRRRAAENGSLEALENPAQAAPKTNKTLSDRWEKLVGNVTSRRLSAERDGENTILTATRMCDEVLGQLYRAMLHKDMSRDRAWSQLIRNARRFRRTL